jgi:hypothetical protein
MSSAAYACRPSTIAPTTIASDLSMRISFPPSSIALRPALLEKIRQLAPSLIACLPQKKAKDQLGRQDDFKNLIFFIFPGGNIQTAFP